MSEKFEYVYSVEQQKRLESIKEKYSGAPKIPTKQEKLISLDRKADEAGIIQSLVLGIIGTLLSFSSKKTPTS